MGKRPLGEYGRVDGRTQVGELTMVDGSQEKVGIESNQDNFYTYMTLPKNTFNKRYFRKEKEIPNQNTQIKTLEQDSSNIKNFVSECCRVPGMYQGEAVFWFPLTLPLCSKALGLSCQASAQQKVAIAPNWGSATP